MEASFKGPEAEQPTLTSGTTTNAKPKKTRSDKGKPKTVYVSSRIMDLAKTWLEHAPSTRKQVMDELSPVELQRAQAFFRDALEHSKLSAKDRMQALAGLFEDTGVK